MLIDMRTISFRYFRISLCFFYVFLSGVGSDYLFGWPKGCNSYNRLGGTVFWYFSPRKAYYILSSSRRAWFLVSAKWATNIAYGVVDCLLIGFLC